MMERLTKLLAIRKKVKSRKPTFRRQDSHKKAKLGFMWRRPRGIQSKVRKNMRGYVSQPSHGYGSPRAVRHFNRFGFKEVMVHNPQELEALVSIKDTIHILLASTIGKRKRVAIVQKAKELGLTIANIKDADSYQEKVKDEIKQRKEKKSVRTKKKEAKEKKASEKKKTDKTIEQKVDSSKEAPKEENTETKEKQDEPKSAPQKKASQSSETKKENTPKDQ